MVQPAVVALLIIGLESLVSELPATSQPVVIGFNSETNKTETNLSRNRT
jgi:hypothetical protein